MSILYRLWYISNGVINDDDSTLGVIGVGGCIVLAPKPEPHILDPAGYGTKNPENGEKSTDR